MNIRSSLTQGFMGVIEIPEGFIHVAQVPHIAEKPSLKFEALKNAQPLGWEHCPAAPRPVLHGRSVHTTVALNCSHN